MLIAAAQISVNSIENVVCALHAHGSKICCLCWKKSQKRQKRGVCGWVRVPGAYAREIMSQDMPLWIMMMPNEPPAKSKQGTRSPCRPARQGDPGPNAPPLGHSHEGHSPAKGRSTQGQGPTVTRPSMAAQALAEPADPRPTLILGEGLTRQPGTGFPPRKHQSYSPKTTTNLTFGRSSKEPGSEPLSLGRAYRRTAEIEQN